jgi:hypothetical protein
MLLDRAGVDSPACGPYSLSMASARAPLAAATNYHLRRRDTHREAHDV